MFPHSSLGAIGFILQNCAQQWCMGFDFAFRVGVVELGTSNELPRANLEATQMIEQKSVTARRANGPVKANVRLDQGCDLACSDAPAHMVERPLDPFALELTNTAFSQGELYCKGFEYGT